MNKSGPASSKSSSNSNVAKAGGGKNEQRSTGPKSAKHKSSASGSNANATAGVKKHSEFLCDLKYKNVLPPIPFEPKFLRYPFPSDRWSRYRLSSLDQHYEYGVHIQPSIGPDLHLIDPTSAEHAGAMLVEADRRLLRRDDERASSLSQRKTGSATKKSMPTNSWLVKTQYIDNDLSRTKQKVNIDAEEARREANAGPPDAATLLARIRKSFEISNVSTAPKHGTKPQLIATKVYHVLPDFDLCENAYYQVSFGDAALAKVERERDGKSATEAAIRLSGAFLNELSGHNEGGSVALLMQSEADNAAGGGGVVAPKVGDTASLEHIRDYGLSVRPVQDQERFVFQYSDKPPSGAPKDDASATFERGTVSFVPLDEKSMDVRRQLDKSSRRRGRKRIVTVDVERTEPTSDEEGERRQRKRQVTMPAASRGVADVFGDSDDDSDAEKEKVEEGEKEKKQKEKDVWGDGDSEEED